MHRSAILTPCKAVEDKGTPPPCGCACGMGDAQAASHHISTSATAPLMHPCSRNLALYMCRPKQVSHKGK
jgi:hypothetical protein